MDSTQQDLKLDFEETVSRLDNTMISSNDQIVTSYTMKLGNKLTNFVMQKTDSCAKEADNKQIIRYIR